MPSALKLPFSLSFLLVAVGVYRFEQSLANESLARGVAGLGMLMVIAIWIFPETLNEALEYTRLRKLIQDLANLAPGLRFIPATIDLIR